MNYKHGLCKSRLYRTWTHMIGRCYNATDAAYDNYGGRGIVMCNEWKNSFCSFYDWALENGYNDSLTIDRIDVDGNYCPENCRWVDQKTQQNNRRDNVFVEYNGKRITVAQLAEITGAKPASLRRRLKTGWSVEKIVNTPYEKQKERLLTFSGKTQNINAWARETGISKITIRNRLNRYGWTVEETLSIRPGKGRC